MPLEADPYSDLSTYRFLSGALEASAERAYVELFPLADDIEPHLRGVVEDALGHPGGQVRSRLSLALLGDLGVDAKKAIALSLAVEYFHTASLLFDDLPCMDDARERRGHLCAHLVHGEAATILGALAFIAKGYSLLWEGLTDLPPTARRRAAALVEACVGINGVLDGQSRDLHFAESAQDGEDVVRVALGKTVSLIRLTILLPAIAAGVEPAIESKLEVLAEKWGFAYQTLDDFRDGLLSAAETGKSTDRDRYLARPNLPAAIGDEAAMEHLLALLDDGRRLVRRLLEEDPRWQSLTSVQELLERGLAQIEERLPGTSEPQKAALDG